MLPAGVPALWNLANWPYKIMNTVEQVKNLFAEPPKWGIYKDDKDVFITEAHGVVSMEFQKETEILNARKEGGALQSFDKVEHPFVARVVLWTGHTEKSAANLLAHLERIIMATELYSLVMPDVTYLNCNIVAMRFIRSNQTGLMQFGVELVVQEVMGAKIITKKATGAPATQAKVNNGQVMPK